MMDSHLAYQLCFERVSADHPVMDRPGFQVRVDQRTITAARWQIQRRVPNGWTGYIVEVDTTPLWLLERPQLVLGTLETRVRARLLPGREAEEGPRAFSLGGEEVFVAYEEPGRPPLTVYADGRLEVEVEALGHATYYGQALATVSMQWRARAGRGGRRQGLRRRRRQGLEDIEGPGRTYTTAGDLLPVEVTAGGTPLWAHMLVRLVVPPDYPLAIARSHLGARTSFLPDELFTLRSSNGQLGVCYDVLFRPGGLD